MRRVTVSSRADRTRERPTMLSDVEQQTLTEIETGLQHDDPVLVQQFSDDRRPTRRGQIVRGWLAIGALALLWAWLLSSALLIVVGLSAISVGMTWWAAPADTDRRLLRDDKLP
jgi:hypothetical protein